MLRKIKDPVSCLTHLAWAILAIPVAVLLVVGAAREGTALHVVSFVIYGIALFLLYLASTIYHMLPISERAQTILRRIDHMMIFVLIAGTYTPICLLPLRGVWGYTLLAIIWGMAIAGIVIKALWLDAPRWLSTGLYVIMGWTVVIAIYPLTQAIPTGALVLLIAGGVTYTLGAVIYAVKWPRFNIKGFGFHEIFHLFVMGGSAFHTVLMFRYVLFVA